MKKLLAFLVLTAFLAAAFLAMAAEEKVNCCVKGAMGEEGKGKPLVRCEKVTKAECEMGNKEGVKAYVVKDCKECK